MSFMDELKEISDKELATPVDSRYLSDEDVKVLESDGPLRTRGIRDDGISETGFGGKIKPLPKTFEQRVKDYAILLNDVFGDVGITTYKDFLYEARQTLQQKGE